MKKTIISLCLLPYFFIGNALAQEKTTTKQETAFDPKSEQKIVNPLGEKIVKALQDGNEELFLDCWHTSDEIIAYIETLPDSVPVPKGEELKAFKKYFDDARLVVKKNFTSILTNIETKGIDRSKITFKSISAIYEVKHGIRGITNATVIFSHDGKDYSLNIDDAFKINNTWKFTDKPDSHVTLVTDSKEKKETP